MNSHVHVCADWSKGDLFFSLSVLAATVRDFDRNSYYLWGMKDAHFNTVRMTRNRDLDVQLMFRTRQYTGILIDLSDSASTESTLHIRLMVLCYIL